MIRLLFQDWWCTFHINQYFSTWNIIVHKWLFIYVYKDFYENIYQNKEVARMVVLLISAIVHEIIITCSTRMFFPCLFVMFFTSGVVGSRLTTKNVNMSHIIWKSLFCWGSGFLMSAYYVEYSIRHHTLIVNRDLIDHITPRTLSLLM